MDLQIVLPDESTDMQPETLVELGVEAERLGFHAVWLPDHLLPPAEYGSTYGGVYEPFITLAHLAARTSRVRLGTSVVILPLRSPILVAKQVATLDRLSGGRVTLGVGTGWDSTEFAAVGVDFGARGRITDEAITLIRHLFDGKGAFDGPFHAFEGGVFAPRPAGPVPIMVGGLSDRAMRRVAELADEWQGVALTPERFAERVATIRSLTDRPVRVGTRIEWKDGLDATAVAAQVREFADAGADAVAVHPGPYPTAAARMAALAEATA
ncbi:TIGR03619 family F420-dependent LLM class oxidoreductase [Actinomycetes bacterium KLBMP 9759]